MHFEDLQLLLLERIRRRVHNGELTERGLARLVGISQPHMHNVLKGKRVLSMDVADRILYHLRLSVLDLCDPKEFEKYLDSGGADPALYSYLPVLAGRLGPQHPLPGNIEKYERFPISSKVVAGMAHPVVCRLAEDRSMHPLFGSADLALLDQSQRARTQIDDRSLYLIKHGRSGVIRRVRQIGTAVYAYAEQFRNEPSSWERLQNQDLGLTHFIRARVILIAAEYQWPDHRN